MEFYISKLNKDLIELGAVEINSKLFEKYNDNCQINLINPKDETRKFKYNCKFHTIKGRGIKGFFSSFVTREYILISQALERKGVTEEKKIEYTQKLSALEIEKEKQLFEANEKYNIDIDISLQSGILYFCPQVKYDIQIDKNEISSIYYNPVLKVFEV